MTVEVKDTGAAKVFQNLRELEDYAIDLGYLGDKGGKIHSNSTVTIAGMAAIHEFGTEHVPATGFIRAAIVRNSNTIAATYAVELGLVFAGKKSIVEALSVVAKQAAGFILTQLRGGDPASVTGELELGVGWRVRRGNATVAAGEP